MGEFKCLLKEAKSVIISLLTFFSDIAKRTLGLIEEQTPSNMFALLLISIFVGAVLSIPLLSNIFVAFLIYGVYLEYINLKNVKR